MTFFQCRKSIVVFAAVFLVSVSFGGGFDNFVYAADIKPTFKESSWQSADNMAGGKAFFALNSIFDQLLDGKNSHLINKHPGFESSKPLKSFNPLKPSDSSKVSKPPIPSKAANPAKQSNPSKAVNPAKQSNPSKAANPSKQSNPSKAANPSKQSNPSKADNPSKQSNPSNPPYTPNQSPAQEKPDANNSTSSGNSTSFGSYEQEAVNLLNADRAAYGLPALKVNMSLVRLAKDYAQDMIERGFFAHENPEGLSPFDRMKNAGINYRWAGENLAINSSVATAQKAFMASAGHRANILNPNFTHVGIGVKRDARGSFYVVQEFIGI